MMELMKMVESLKFGGIVEIGEIIGGIGGIG